MHSAQGQLELMDQLRRHTDQYASHIKSSYCSMVEVWADLEVEDDQQRQELQEVMIEAVGCWTAKVQDLQTQQQSVRDSIQQALRDIQSIKEELGADNPAADAELQKLQGNRSAHRTLRAWQQDVLSKAHYWQKCKQQRIADYEDLQARIRLLRQLCGLPPQPPAIEKPSINRSSMEFLKLELERLATEKERREDLLRQLLDQLTAVCGDIGEDVRQAVTEVHPNLVYLWDAEAARVLRDVYRLGSSYSSSGSGMIDLSDSTISRLGSKLATMKDLKASRDAHAAEVLSVLHSLWDATEVPAEERSHFVRMMSGPLRLHAASLEKCMAEVRRLEDVRYQQMVDLVLAKGAELTAMCLDSHVEEPAGLQDALTAMDSSGRNPGAAAELLAKILHMLAEVQVLTGKRATIIAAIKEVEAAREEDVWLSNYEADDQRYKGRDANKKLQRAIRAGKLRERLPSLVDDLRRLLAEWKDCEGEAFLFDGRDYEFEVLDGLAAAVEEAAAARAAKAARAATSRRQSMAGAAACTLTSPTSSSSTSSRPPTATPRKSTVGGLNGSTSSRNVAAASASGTSRRAAATTTASVMSPGARRAGGPSTPMPLRGVTSRSLSERHSICVLRDRESVVGPAALSRSGEVRLGHSSSNNSRTNRPAADTAVSSRRLSSEAMTPPAAARRPSSGGGLPAAGLMSAAASPIDIGLMTPPPAGKDTHMPAGIRSPASGCKRVSTSSKLDSIFRRSSVQHPVAMLDASGPTDSASKCDQNC